MHLQLNQLNVNLFSVTPPKDARDAPIEHTTKTNTKVIVIVQTLLTLLILITLIVFYVMYARRRNFKKQGYSYSSIHLFTIKQISFCYTKSKSWAGLIKARLSQPRVSKNFNFRLPTFWLGNLFTVVCPSVLSCSNRKLNQKR